MMLGNGLQIKNLILLWRITHELLLLLCSITMWLEISGFQAKTRYEWASLQGTEPN